MSALVLKLIACICMLLDHIGYCWGIGSLRIVGRIAFPIFVYLIYNGYRHTSSKAKYALRLALFALISQIPFNLFGYGTLWSNNGNVFFTLLAALLCLWSVDGMFHHRILRWFSLLPTLAVCLLYYKGILASDYGAIGILMLLVFYFCDRPGAIWKVLTVLGFYCAIYHGQLLQALLSLMGNTPLPVLSPWWLTQFYAGLALPFIFAYNGEKGTIGGKTGGKLLQYGFYLFYPLHMVVLWLIFQLT